MVSMLTRLKSLYFRNQTGKFVATFLRGPLRDISSLTRVNPRVKATPGTRVQKRKVFTLGEKPDDGVALIKGSIWDQIHQKFREVLSQGMIFHMGKVLTLVSCFTTDWVFMRLALMSSAMCSTTFHFVFPDPRPMRMFYGALFAVGHSYALFKYLLEHSNLWEIQDPEQRELYEEIFKTAGFTVYHLKQIIENCDVEVVDVEEGDYLLHQGDELKSYYFLVCGEAQYRRKMDDGDAKLHQMRLSPEAVAALQREEHTIAHLGAGAVVGEIYDEEWDPSIDHKWRVGVRAATKIRLLRINRRKYKELVESSAAIRTATDRLIIKDLWRSRRNNAVRIAGLMDDLEEFKEEVHKLRSENERLRHQH